MFRNNFRTNDFREVRTSTSATAAKIVPIPSSPEKEVVGVITGGNEIDLFELALNFGPLAKYPLRKTFFGQFVGDETSLPTLDILVVVDSEFFSCRPAIAAIGLALMARHSQHDYLVGNTIQGYLKSAVATIESELEVVDQANWFGKIVRGAYMDRERKIASSQGITSPICDSYEETSNSYNR